MAFTVGLVLDAAAAPAIDPNGGLLLAVGVILAAVGAFTRPDPRDGLPTWFATVFGAIYASFLGYVLRLGQDAPAIPAGSALSWFTPEQGWILLLVLTVWAYDTGAYFIGKRFGRRKFLTHISPSKTYAGLVGGIVASTVVVGLLLTGPRPEPDGRGGARGRCRPRRPGRRPGGVRASSVRPAQRTRATLIPGHGGMLDRMDSFLFAAPDRDPVCRRRRIA